MIDEDVVDDDDTMDKVEAEVMVDRGYIDSHAGKKAMLRLVIL